MNNESIANEAIKISNYTTIDKVNEALEIVKIFKDEGKVFVPAYHPANWNFITMVSAIWTAGYLSGIRKEREKKKA